MLFREVIKKKRQGEELTKKDLQDIIAGYLKEEVPDYQMSALLMAIYFQGMSEEEIKNLTLIMRDSGEVLDHSDIALPKVDKHSTGGVGDKTSMLIAPIVACHELCVPMMAGRSLGHTGGTLDKLESIPGYRVNLEPEEFKKQLKELGCAIIGQSNKLAPADRRLYALRDVTATVESIPLITASILSKKLAAGIDTLTMDVKFGSGAFMKSMEEARALALSLKQVGELAGKKISVILSSMDQVLGSFAGNALEIFEVEEILKGSTKYQDTTELSLQLASHMIYMGKRADSLEEAYQKAEESLTGGAAYEKWQRMCEAQGGNLKDLPQAYEAKDFVLDREGYIKSMDVEKLGLACILLDAGRKTKEDKIDPRSGLEVLLKVGDKVEAHQPVLKIYANPSKDLTEVCDLLRSAFQLADEKTSQIEFIQEVIIG